ncbi:unnamed protein product [Calypogeia fissa]
MPNAKRLRSSRKKMPNSTSLRSDSRWTVDMASGMASLGTPPKSSRTGSGRVFQEVATVEKTVEAEERL